MTFHGGGWGAEHYGDPFGLGGPLSVVRAIAVAGQVIRVVFDEEPCHFSPASSNDALNNANYSIAIIAGSGIAPQAVGVDRAMASPPAVGVYVGTDERAFDVRVDRPLAFGIRYRVRCSRIQARAGGSLGAPYQAEFMGVVPFGEVRTPSRRTDLIDISNDPFIGKFGLDGSGDLAIQGGADSYRKRVIRRIVTPKGAYSWDPGYGTTVRLKRTLSVSELGSIQRDVQGQIMLEPETEAVSVQASIGPGDILTLQIFARAKAGSLAMTVSVSPDGTIQVR